MTKFRPLLRYKRPSNVGNINGNPTRELLLFPLKLKTKNFDLIRKTNSEFRIAYSKNFTPNKHRFTCIYILTTLFY